MRTAMQELLGFVEQMYSSAKTPEVESTLNDVINLITQQGIDIEKMQIVDAIVDSQKDRYDNVEVYPPELVVREAEQYYNETYGQTQK